MSQYTEIYRSWQTNPENFWANAALEIDWFRPADKIFDPSQGMYGRWFVGAQCNTCYNCIDRHIDHGRGDQAAIIYDSPVTDTKRTITYKELLEEVSLFAAGLQALGVENGDRVLLYMPMIPEALIAMLACARIGAVHSVVFGGFAANELATRIDDAKPKVMIAASCGIEPGRIVAYKPLLDKAMELAAHKPRAAIIYQRPMEAASMIEGRDYDWGDVMTSMRNANNRAPCVSVNATDPLYILYTSGTTGVPKGVVRDNGGHMVALKWSMNAIYGIEPGETYWAASDVGWVVGHSYIVYAPLLHGCTTIVFEGKPVGTPDAGVFWRIIAEHNVSALFTAPTAFRAIKKEDPEGALIKNYDLSKFRTLFLAGERTDPDTLHWAEKHLGVPVIDHWWQTETAWAIAANPVGLGMLPVKAGSPTVAMPGYDIRILNDENNEVPAGETGAISIKLPLPPGCLPSLWRNDAGFWKSYTLEYPGYYMTADAGYKDEDDYIFVMSRTDDIINVAGHRLSTGAMEEAVISHPHVAECAVIGVEDKLKGQIPLGFIVLNAGVDRNTVEVEAEVIKLVRDQIGPVAAFKQVVTVIRLPKTRSGKILRGTMRAIADGKTYKTPATIDDPAILVEITEALQGRGVAA